MELGLERGRARLLLLCLLRLLRVLRCLLLVRWLRLRQFLERLRLRRRWLERRGLRLPHRVRL